MLGENQTQKIITEVSNFNPFKRRDIAELFMRFRVNKKVYTIEIKNITVLSETVKYTLFRDQAPNQGYIPAYYEQSDKKTLQVLRPNKYLASAVKDVLLEIGRVDGEVSRTFQHTEEINSSERNRVLNEMKASITLTLTSGEVLAGPGYMEGMYVV